MRDDLSVREPAYPLLFFVEMFASSFFCCFVNVVEEGNDNNNWLLQITRTD